MTIRYGCTFIGKRTSFCKTQKYKPSNGICNSLIEKQLSSCITKPVICMSSKCFLCLQNTSNLLLFPLHEVTSSSGQTVSELAWHSVAPSPALFITSASWRIFQKQPSNSREAQQTRLMTHVDCLSRSGPFCSAGHRNCHRDRFILRISTKEAQMWLNSHSTWILLSRGNSFE